MSNRTHFTRIEIVGNILDAFKCDSRYKVKYSNLSHAYQLYLNSTNTLLAEFGNQIDKLVEPAFKDSFSEIERKICAKSDKLKYQASKFLTK